MNHSKDLMIDIETLGTESNSVILSIGAVQFCIQTGELFGHFHRVIDIDSCLQAGMKVTGSTIRWWMTQSDEARELFKMEGVSLKEALIELQEGLQDIDTVWANGTDFDISLIKDAHHNCGLQLPWPYYAVRDYRTVTKMLPKEVFERLRVKPDVAHSAVDDAVAQARTLANINTYLSGTHGFALVP